MRMQGSVTKVETVDVDISPSAMVDALDKQWHCDIKMFGHYINLDGFWEDWTDTGHGSGITKVLREATEEEKTISKAFRTLRQIKFSK